MSENMAESGRKRSKVELAQLMAQADNLIINGATHEEAAARVGLPLRTFDRHYKTWSQVKCKELQDSFKEAIWVFLIRHDRLYSNAMQAGQLAVAARVNVEKIEMLQNLGLAPKAGEKVESANQVGWKEIWESMYAKRSKNVQSV